MFSAHFFSHVNSLAASKHEVEVSTCTNYQNTICRCEDGYYKVVISKDTDDCRKCKQCAANEKEIQKCKSKDLAMLSITVIHIYCQSK